MTGQAGIVWRRAIAGRLGSRSPPRPEKPALVVVDMQRYFLEESAPAYLGVKGIIPNVQLLVNAFESAGLPIFVTRYCSAEVDGPVEKWWNVRLEPGEIWAELDPRIAYPESATILEKHLYGTFASTDIDARLKKKGCDSVVICGVMTHLCCETTAREAFHHGYGVLFVADANATSSDEMHISTLRALAHGFAHIVSADEITKLLGENDG